MNRRTRSVIRVPSNTAVSWTQTLLDSVAAPENRSLSPKSTQTWLPVHTLRLYSDWTLRSSRLVMMPLESTPLSPVGLIHALIVRPVVPCRAEGKSMHAVPEKVPTRPREVSMAGIAPLPVRWPSPPLQLFITGLPVAGQLASSICALRMQPRARSIGGGPSGVAWTLPQPARIATISQRYMARG